MGKTGLIIEGGATRGIYAAGVLDVFYEKGIRFDGVIGVSAGAVHGCSFVSCQPGRSIRYYLAYSASPRFASLRNLIFTGSYIGTQFCYHDLPEQLCPFDHYTFENSDTQFYVTCTDVDTGGAYYRRTPSLRGTGMDALRASASLPILSKIVQVDGLNLLDGGIADSIPLVAFQEMGFDRCVVVLTRPSDYRKPPSCSLLAKFLYRKKPAFVASMLTRHIRYNEALDEVVRQEKSGLCIAVRPSETLSIGRLEKNTEKILSMYELGRADATTKIGAIRAFLE